VTDGWTDDDSILHICYASIASCGKNYKFHEIFVRYLWPWLGPPLTIVQCVMYFRFLWTTLFFIKILRFSEFSTEDHQT